MKTEWTTKDNKDKNCTKCKHGKPFEIGDGIVTDTFYSCDLDEKRECASWPEHRTCEHWSAKEV